ncbi:hypothetical protein ACWGCW_25685 [Streptomyces sp. NPDC054933]
MDERFLPRRAVMTARSRLRAGLIALAVSQGLAGVIQLLLPRRFYDDFPTPRHPWVAMLPPYNEHLMRDVGALTLAYVLVLGVAAVSMEQRMVRTALAANLVFTVPHFIFHAAHLRHVPPVDAITQTIALGLGVVLPVALLYLSKHTHAADEPAADPGSHLSPR